MKYSKSYIECRISKLSNKPVENAKIINKWKRLLRRIENN